MSVVLVQAIDLQAQLTLRWNDESMDELGFEIERAAGGGNFEKIATVGPNLASFVDREATGASAYAYRIRAFNEAGYSTYSNTATTTPVIVAQPAARTVVSPGATATFTVVVTAIPPWTLQWQVNANRGAGWTNLANGAVYSGVTTETLAISGAPADFEGFQFRAVATNSAGTVISNPALLSVAPTSRLANLSVRALAGTGNSALIVGFAVGGGSLKTLLVRGIGPTLASFGVAAPLGDPVLSLFAGARLVESNDDWGSASNASRIAETAASVGAFPLSVAARDAAILSTVGEGTATVQVSGKDGASGVALIELYDADPGNGSRMNNVSARAFVGTGPMAPIAGFVVGGTAPKQVLVRAVGPTLAGFGVTGLLADPQLALFREGSLVPVQQNDNWGGTAALRATFSSTGAFPLPDGSRDAALTAVLQPGAYSVLVTGTGNTTGVALLEVYELP